MVWLFRKDNLFSFRTPMKSNGSLYKCLFFPSMPKKFPFTPRGLGKPSIVRTPPSCLTVTQPNVLLSQVKFGQSRLNSVRLFCSSEWNSDTIGEFHLREGSYEPLTPDDFKELIKDEEDLKKIKTILSEYEVIKYETGFVPSTLTLSNMSQLMLCNVLKREKILTSWFKRELTKYQRKKEPAKPLPERHPHLEIERRAGKNQIMGVRFDEHTGAPLYGEWLNSYFLRFRKSEHQHSFDRNILSGMLFGPKLIIDCSYDLDYMDSRRLVGDIHRTLKEVGNQTDPFNVICVGPFKGSLRKQLETEMSSFDSRLGYVGPQLDDRSILEMLNPKEIVYLSPDAGYLLQKYQQDKVYVLGGLPSVLKPELNYASLARCKSLGIKAYRLPIEDNFVFKRAKSISLYECFKILDHLKDHNDMGAALKHGISPNRYKTDEELKEQASVRMERMLKRSMRSWRKDSTSIKFS